MVVIGILIALGINNWNEHRITEKSELELMRVLSKELTASSDYLSSRIEWLDQSIEDSGMKVLEYTKSQRKDIKIDSFSYHLLSTMFLGGFAPPTAKFQQIVNGQGMDLIRFDSIQLLLIEYQNQLDLAYRHDLQIQDISELEAFWNQHLVAHTIFKHGGHGWHNLFENDEDSYFKIDISSAISNAEFENIIVNRLELLNSARKRLRITWRHNENIRNLIERYYHLQ